MLAQTTGGSLQGKIADPTGQPIPGVLVQVTGPSVQGYLGAATDADGQYLIPFVPAGRGYEVKVEAEGYGTVVRKGIEVPLGVRVDLPFVLSEGKTEVVVSASAPLIDLQSTQAGATLSSRMIQILPLQRDSSQIVFLTPTAVDSGSSSPGMASIGGATGAENVYLVNGMDVTNALFSVTPFTTFRTKPVVVAGSLTGGMLNFEFIRDMQVMSGGVAPEYGGGMGGIVNAITQSGGNEFHGSLFAYYWSDSLQAKSIDYPYAPTITGNAGYTRYDVGVDLGGYFIKDKLWFYLGYDYNRMKEFTQVPSGAEYGDQYLYLNGRPAQSAFAGQRITDASEINQQYAFKLTWNAGPDHKLALSVFGNHDRLDGLATLATLSPDSVSYTVKTPSVNLSLEWNATWSPTFFSEAVVSYHDSTRTVQIPPLGANSWAYQYYFSQGLWGGFYALPKDNTVPPVSINGLVTDLGQNYAAAPGFDYYRDIPKDTAVQVRLKATNLFNGAGRHELSYGFQTDARQYTRFIGQSGPADFVSPKLHRQAIGGLYIQWAPASLLDFPIGSHGEQYVYQAVDIFTPPDLRAAWSTASAWVNDNWSPSDFLTLKLGLRYDEEAVEGKLPGGQSIHLKNNYAPRIGFTWDVTHHGKSKLYGFWGRYFQRVPANVGTVSLNPYMEGREYFYDPQLTVWTGTSHFFGSGGMPIQGQTPGLPVNSSLKAPYTDETLLGFDYEVRPNLRIGVRAVYRELGRAIEDISFDGAQTYILANPDLWSHIPVPGINPDWSPNWQEVYYFPKPTRIYRALEVTLDKRFSNNWQMGASYVLSRLEGNYEGETASNDTPTGWLNPSITPAFDLPQIQVNGYGLLPLDRTHVLKVYGGYTFPNIPLEISANFALQSGTPVSKQVQMSWYGTWGYYDTRGSNGRTPTTWSLDLGAQYTIALGKRWGHLGIRLDVFNVFNQQKPTAVYQVWAQQAMPGGPMALDNSLWSKPYAHQAPRLMRLGLRWTF